MPLNTLRQKKIEAAEKKFSLWIRVMVESNKFGSIEMKLQPGNPEPHILVETRETEKI